MSGTVTLEPLAHAHWQAAADRAHAVFGVEGMRCAACARAIERAVQGVPGVRGIAVNVATARAAVEWDAARTSLPEILRAVTGSGFRPVPLAGEPAVAAHRAERRTMIKRIGLAGLGMMQTMMFMYGLYAAGPDGIDPDMAQYLRVVSMLLTTPVLLYSGAPFLQGAWRDLRRRSLGMDVPVALALLLAWAASTFNTLRGSGEVYFDSVTMFIFFLLAGRFMEMTVRQRSLGASEALARSLPVTVTRLGPDGTGERIPVSAVRAGDRLSIARGAVIPVDGTLALERASVDEALVTGESTPLAKRRGERLLGGSVNLGHPIEVVAAESVERSTLAMIVGLLERAQASRPPLQRAADRAATWFVLCLLLLASLVAIGWALVDPSRAFAATLAVLVVTCPCALSLATPAALAAATTRLARLGLLVTRADAIERLARIDTVMLDKTGTLTVGSPAVQILHLGPGMTRERALGVAAALERSSSHPLAAAFAPHADPAVVAREVREYPGAGLEGTIAGRTWRLGQGSFVADARTGARDAPAAAAADDGVVLGSAAGTAAIFAVADPLRPDARHSVAMLRRLGLEVCIASGDRDAAVRTIGASLGIESTASRLKPEQKLAAIRAAQARGRRVLMIGDGINDGPVLAAANVSCAMAQGSAVAQAAADLLLLSGSLQTVAEAVQTARNTLTVMRQNLRWAFVYNFAAVPLAALGLIAPWVAAIGMSLSSLAVVLNAARLARAAPQPVPLAGAAGTPA